jgi:MFS family permease
MIYPVFTVYAPAFTYSNPTSIGIALGVYGLTQAILQPPLSILSDRIGRKPVMMGGLILFAAGSVLCALTHNIYILILGRAFQGAGAIGSTAMACAADYSTVENRTKAMALMGLTIGVSFALAMVLGPLVNSWFKLTGIFWLTAIFAFVGIGITYFFIPSDRKNNLNPEPFWQGLSQVLKKIELVNLNVSVLLLHALFTASFMVLPLLLTSLGFPTVNHWKIYLPILIASFFITFLLLIISEKKKCVSQILLLGIALIGAGEYLFAVCSLNVISTQAGLLLFFIGFTVLEALLPSLVSKNAPADKKGTAMGIFSCSQFLGIFIGGSLAGFIHSHESETAIFYSCLTLCLVWFIFILLSYKHHGIAKLKESTKIFN